MDKPAFPIEWKKGMGIEHRGMTLRQWYAGTALQGYMASGRDIRPMRNSGKTSEQLIAEKCLRQADAMMETTNGSK